MAEVFSFLEALLEDEVTPTATQTPLPRPQRDEEPPCGETKRSPESNPLAAGSGISKPDFELTFSFKKQISAPEAAPIVSRTTNRKRHDTGRVQALGPSSRRSEEPSSNQDDKRDIVLLPAPAKERQEVDVDNLSTEVAGTSSPVIPPVEPIKALPKFLNRSPNEAKARMTSSGPGQKVSKQMTWDKVLSKIDSV